MLHATLKMIYAAFVAFQQLTRPDSLTDQAYESIRRAILNHELEPGDRLSVPDLARRLGVSRSPVREAIVRLEREGLARFVANRGAEVALSDSRDVVELLEVREALEGYIARLAAVRLTDTDLSSLRELLSQHRLMVTAADLDGHVATDLEFHRRVREGCGNRRLIELHETLHAQIRVALYSTASKPGNPQLAVEEHEALFDALEARDPVLAEQKAREHVRRVRESMFSGLSD